MAIGLSGSAFAARSMNLDGCAGTSLAAGEVIGLSGATIGGCSASTESTGSTLLYSTLLGSTVASRVAL
jgi:hypothetical protein